MTDLIDATMTEHGHAKTAPHLLIVDDDRDITSSLQHFLLENGFHVSVAYDGNQGVAYVETQQPDLMILDMMMPRRSGFLVLERLIRSQVNPFPIIMITGNEGNLHKEYAEMLGVNDYIKKPFPMERLLGSVNNLLG
ncbi:MAG: response regulator [Planctomycetota bacterium]